MRVTALVGVAVALLLQVAPQAQRTVAAASRPGEILVKFRPGISASLRSEAHRQSGGRAVAEVARTGVQRVAVNPGTEQSAIARYAGNPNVLYAEPNYLRRIPRLTSHAPGSEPVVGDAYYDEQWALHNTGQMFYCIPWIDGEELCFYIGTPDADIDAPQAWAITKGSPAVKVAVIDSGLDYTHPDLAGNYLGGYDFVGGTTDPMDEHGHGTHVAGTIGAALGNLTGTPGASEGVVGVAPDVRLLAYKVCRVDGTCDDFAIQDAVAQAIADGAHVINMSLGETAFSQSLNDAVQDAWTAGLVIVAGAGNNGSTEPFYPAAFDNVISVGAFDEDHRRAAFSNYGDWVDMSAPGNAILSAYPMAACAGSAPVPGDTGCYNFLSGTSMATPHVSGAAALVWSRPGVTSNSQVVEILLNSADRAGVDTTRLETWTIHGGLNLHDALTYGAPVNLPPIAHAGQDQTVTANASGTVSVTLNGSSSSDPDGTIQEYQWSEGSIAVATGPTPAVTLAVGEHTLTLRVTDNAGGTDDDTVLITILPAPAQGDVVSILLASYQRKRGQLTIEATSSGAPDVSLVAYDESSGATLGSLSYNRKKRIYAATFKLPAAPAAVRVVSSGGGSDTAPVAGG